SLVLAKDMPRPTGARPDVPPLVSRRSRVPNVLFVLTESVRASDYSSDQTSALLPSRYVLRQMRSISAYTAISASALLTGRTQVGRREPIRAAADLFDYARATREGDERVSVHYWSAQSPTIFERDDLEAVVDSLVTADTLRGRVTDDDGDAI